MTLPSYTMSFKILWVLLALLPEVRTDARLAEAAKNGDAAAVRALVEQKVDVNAPGPDGTPPLYWAIQSDDLATTQLLIRAGADVKTPNRYGITPIGIAAGNGNVAMIRALLEAGADPNTVDPANETPLISAVRSGEFDAVRLLLEHGAKVDWAEPTYGQTALMFAVREASPAIVDLLIKKGASIDVRTRTGPTPAFRPANPPGGGSHGVGIVRSGLPERGNRQPIPGSMTPLLYAARDGKLEALKLLVSAGADINEVEANGISVLLMAIGNNRMDVARFLIDKGADVNHADWYGRTPLWQAVEVRNMDLDSSTYKNNVENREEILELVGILLEHGANPNARTKEVPPWRRTMLPLGSLEWVDFVGMTPFIYAARSADLPVMKLLLKHGADPNITPVAGTTALMAAAGINWVVKQTYSESNDDFLKAVEFLYDVGQDVNAVNSMGLRAIHGAANRGSDDIIKFLVAKGAKLDVKDNEGRSPMDWAQGVFLATHPPEPKPRTIALLKELMEKK
jgi:ankyrin repeat protein